MIRGFLVLLFASVGTTGCEYSQTIEKGGCVESVVAPDVPPIGDAGVGNIVAFDGGVHTDLCAPYTDTVFSSLGEGDVHAICGSCNDTCDIEASSCDVYGVLCDANGLPGICTTCCFAGEGELRCTPL